MIAAKAGDKEDLERAIDEGVDVDYQNEVLITFLMRKAVLLKKESHGFPHERAEELRRGQGIRTICFFLPVYSLFSFLSFSSFLFCSSFPFLLVLSHQF